ncbi:M6 family metalloprotease domain-containing protein [Streptomyces sp. RB6PN25]|uniref:M6 family metalloprotease domain-containing protein n=1 Tax=Streptomyces humicola TaxID=2953240 RepID=A0ABT1Q852_9ACTN|nr:M6 family metalloprotease domain-containing protein [Streptomyces humicola]MCQ4084967.1 M6 family metalloprotease domain-containing protein [Streptomyces humicola]
MQHSFFRARLRAWPRAAVVAGVLCAAGVAAPGAVSSVVSAADAPDAPDAPSGACALQRTDSWLSEGVTPWDPDHVRPVGTVHAKMIFVRFPGHTPANTPQQLAAHYLPSVPQFYARASYGKAKLDIVPVASYVAMPMPAAAYGIHRAEPYAKMLHYIRDAVAAARRTGVNFRGVQTLYIVADPDAPGADHDATATTTLARRDAITADGTAIRNISMIWEAAKPDRNVVAHESGHLFGLPDLYVQPPWDDLRDDWDTKVGDWDLMGDQRAISPEFLAWEKWKFGWLDPAQVHCVAAAGVSVHTLTPTERTGGTKLVVVKRSDTDAYAVEVRSRYGNDRRTCAEGVLLYHVRTDVGSTHGPIRVLSAHPGSPAPPNCRNAQEPALADAPFRTGESYTADHGRFRLQVLGQDARGNYRIQITAPAPRSSPDGN